MHVCTYTYEWALLYGMLRVCTYVYVCVCVYMRAYVRRLVVKVEGQTRRLEAGMNSNTLASVIESPLM